MNGNKVVNQPVGEVKFMQCHHKPGRADWLSIPNGTVKNHPICDNCGTVKNVSSDRGKKLSYFITFLSRLKKYLERRGYRVSEAQMRLISKELEEFEGFCDTWWITYTKQKEIFVDIFKKYVRVSPHLLNEIL